MSTPGLPGAIRLVQIDGHAQNGSDKKPHAATLSAHDISYRLQVACGRCSHRSKETRILYNITGIFQQGMNAIMGPTGSGKTSFLDILAGRKDPEGVSGQLLLNGKQVPSNFKCMVGYVVQEDVVMGTLTVKENLAFSAALRLPTTISSKEKKERVNEVISELQLDKCANTKIGTEFLRGVSGGEKKRCNIGMELIISPPVLFLDEPTTGLDANTATTVLMILKRLSRKGRSIIFSIHQPRYSIYQLFDNLTILSQGCTVYHGPAPEAIQFFATQGFQCQEYNNPPDFFLDIINGDPSTFMDLCAVKSSQDTCIEMTRHNCHNKLVDGFKASAWNTKLMSEAKLISTAMESHVQVKRDKHHLDYMTSFCHQIKVVAGRALINILRNPHTSILTIVFTIIFASIIATIYWHLDETSPAALKDRSGVIFFLIMNHLFFNMSAVEVFINERRIFMHEHSSGYYRVSVYFIVKIFFDILPLRLVPVIIVCTVVYFSVGLNPGIVNFLLFMSCLFCTTMAAASLCFLVSSTIRVFAVAQLLLAFCYVLMILLGGFLINPDTINAWLNWIQYLSLFRYALNTLYIIEFKDRVFCPNGTNCREGNVYLQEQNIAYAEPWDFWQNYVALVSYGWLLLILTYIQLRRMKKTF
ncbi:unnamed protein product [Lymnaea stagnalis]|uniref:ABC transporter domain-containing protein n=1 Tax=Lymnaea stagnalis TaxID=6523 RepID=A0AAV2HW69_LYMST